MTLDELKAKIHEDFALAKMPDYMKGADVVLFLLAKPLWAIEYDQTNEVFKDLVFELVVNLPSSRFFTTQGGRYIELYSHALATSNRPLTLFLRRAIAHGKQQASMLGLPEYSKLITTGRLP